MEYIRWANREDAPLVSRLGFGTTRFNLSDLHTPEGLEKCVRLVEHAITRGINYFDVAPTYSNGFAEKILGEAFKHTSSPIYVAAKTGLMIDRTSDDVLRRIDLSLKILGKEKIEFYHAWSVMNWEEYLDISQTGGILDGILQAREKGLIDHVCISLHCDPQTVLRIIDGDIFEGITISLNAMNYRKWLDVLKRAREKHIAVVTMNSLAGGVIPQYGGLFNCLDESCDSVPQKALRFVLQLPGVHVALSGMPDMEKIDENCNALDHISDITSDRNFALPVKEVLCSGCNYCAPCTIGIPISSCMQGYNHKILVESAEGAPQSRRLANEVFIRLRANGVNFPETKTCIRCRKCEERCTQKLDITKRLAWLADMANSHGYTLDAMHRRFEELERECAHARHIAIWPACDYATRALDLWANPEFEKKCEFFNSSPAMWGKEYRGKKIRKPSELESLEIDTVIIMHYRLQEEIRRELLNSLMEVKILGLHKEGDIDWFNRAAGK